MATCRHPLPGFKATCLTVCGLYVLLGGSIVVRGARASMAPYGVPAATLDSPHYADASTWVYLHMVVIGILTGVLGWFSEPGALRVWMARALFGAHLIYTWLDVRASDSPLGTALYRGPASVVPAVLSLGVTVLLAHLVFCGAEVSRSGSDR